MSAIVGRRLVWSVWVVATVAPVGALSISAWDGGAVSWILFTGVPVLGFSSMGLVLCLRVPGNPIGWLFLIMGFALGVGIVCDAYAARVPQLPGGLAAALVASLFEELPWPLLAVVLLLFPEGRLPSRRWRPVMWLWALAVIILVLSIVLKPDPNGIMFSFSGNSLVDPLLVSGTTFAIMKTAGAIALLVFFSVTFAAAGSLILRFRRATGDLRQQLKWFGAAAALLALAGASTGYLWSTPASWAGVVWRSTLVLAETGVVIATGIAILRYRLYQIDVIIRKTLVYTTLAGSLAVAYLGGVYLIGGALRALTGQSGVFAVTLSTLAVAVMFQPIRSRIQRAVDHRFYRRKYDAARTLDAFINRLRDQVDLDALSADLLDVVATTVQPSHASLWLRSSRPLAAGSMTTPVERGQPGRT